MSDREKRYLFMETMYSNNKLIRKIIVSMFGGSFAAMVTLSIALMTDTLLAGSLFGKAAVTAVAAVAVGTPIINIFQALTQSVIQGACVKMNIFAGKGETQKLQSAFSTGVFYTVILGLIFIGLCQAFAGVLTGIFGASGKDVATMAEWYLRGATGCIVFGTLNLFMIRTLALFGRQRAILLAAIVAIVFNIVFSLIWIKVLPDDMKIAGLGFGTWMGGALACTFSYCTLRKYNLSVKFKLKELKFSEFIGFIRLGISTSGNNLADGVVSGVVNNIIVSGANGVVALAVFTVIKSITTFCTAIIQAINISVAPLFGIMYGSRDRNGLLRACRESIKLALISLFICAVVVIAASPLLAKVFGVTETSPFYQGLAICMLCYMPLTAILRITTQLFESIEKVGIGFLYSAVPDSIIFPVMLAILWPVMGYYGIWISYSLNAIPFIIILFLVRSVINRNLKFSYDRVFCFEKEIRDNVPNIDISIKSDNKDVTFVSERIYDFLIADGVEHRIAHATALCLEEISADFVKHTVEDENQNEDKTIMDIKLFSDEDKICTIIRNDSAAYNPLDFEGGEDDPDKMGVKLAEKFADSITYSYVYKMNIVTIGINKHSA